MTIMIRTAVRLARGSTEAGRSAKALPALSFDHRSLKLRARCRRTALPSPPTRIELKT
jgi:hypothetical protein